MHRRAVRIRACPTCTSAQFSLPRPRTDNGYAQTDYFFDFFPLLRFSAYVFEIAIVVTDVGASAMLRPT